METLLRISDVRARTGLKRATLYRLVARGELEAPVKISERCAAWRASAVQAFIEGRIAAAGRDPHRMRHSETGESLVRA